MKSWMLSIMILFLSGHMWAQNWCDSTLTICDSVSLDSIFFTHTFGDRMHVSMINHHEYLYAPSFVLCTANEDLELDKNHYGYFSLFGPSTVMPYYDFLNFNLIGDSLYGSIILDNTNNGRQNCVIPFQVLVQPFTNISNQAPSEVTVYPNPANSYLYLLHFRPDNPIRTASLITSLGSVIPVEFSSDGIDISHIPQGFYVLRLELQDGNLISRKVLISSTSN